MKPAGPVRLRLLALKGGLCAKCGATDKLQVDHIREGDGKKLRKKHGNYSEHLRLEQHPEEFQVLCKPCHGKKTMRWVRAHRQDRDFRCPDGVPRWLAELKLRAVI